MIMEIELKILKSDILEKNYMNSKDCPITRALRRAGYPNLMDEGGQICDEEGKIVAQYPQKKYMALSKRVVAMHGYATGHRGKSFEVPKTFKATINLKLPKEKNV